MTEQQESLIDTLSKVSSLDDLRAALPPTLTEKLGEGDKGKDRALALLIGLAPFAPEPATFDRAAFDAVVAFDEETNQPLNAEGSQKLLDAALEVGFLKRDVAKPERLVANPKISPLVDKFFKE
jgi:hypothetical protein